MIIKFADGKGYFDSETKTALIMRDGVYTYLAMEFPSLVGIGADKENNPFAKLRVYRSKDSVKAAYERFKELGKIPVVFNHPEKDLDRNDFSQGYGYAPELVDEGANLAIKCKLELNADSLEAYKDGIREISCGWSGDFVEPSEEDKKLYDFEQTFSDFNHIALVSEGRCGSLCSIKDSKANENKQKDSQEGLNGLIGAEKAEKKGATKMKDKKKLFSDACKYVDELEKVVAEAKKSETVEDSHAEGLLNAVKGLKDVIKGLEEFAKEENKEIPEGSEPKDPAAEGAEVEDGDAGAEEDTKVVPVDGKPGDEDGKTEDEAPEAGKEGEEGDAEDKRQILREADKVAMLPISEFEGGEEEKFRTLTALLEKLGYWADRAKKVNDAAIAKRITDAKNEGMKIAVKRFHDVLPFIADGTIPFSDIKAGMTPCEIKQKFVEERTGIKYNDAASLGVAFEVVAKSVAAESWNIKDTKEPQNLLDKKMAEVANIGMGQKK